MKNIISISILLISTFLINAQQVNFPIDKESGEIVYTDVVDVSNATKDDLFIASNKWFAENFKSSKDVINFSDKDAGLIMAKGNLAVTLKVNGGKEIGYVSFSMEVGMKNGKYRYIIKDFWHHNGTSNIKSPGDLRIEKSGMQLTRKGWDAIKIQTDTKMKYLISSLYEDTVSAPSNDNW